MALEPVSVRRHPAMLFSPQAGRGAHGGGSGSGRFLLLRGDRVGVTSMSGWRTAGGASVVWAVAGRHSARTPAAPSCSTLSSRPYPVWAARRSVYAAVRTTGTGVADCVAVGVADCAGVGVPPAAAGAAIAAGGFVAAAALGADCGAAVAAFVLRTFGDDRDCNL